MGDESTPRGADPVAVAGSMVWALVGILLSLVVLQSIGLATLWSQLFVVTAISVTVSGFVYWMRRDERSPHPLSAEHPLDSCAEVLAEMQTRVLPGPVHEHLGYLRDVVDAERRRTPAPGIEQRGQELLVATERLVLAHQDLVGSRLAEPVARTAALEATLRTLHDDTGGVSSTC